MTAAGADGDRGEGDVLHVTNGHSAVERLRAAGVSGDLLPWRDALHEGPVPAYLDPARMRVERARFMAAAGWTDEPTALAHLTERDERLARVIADREPVVLWFESPRGLADLDGPVVVRDAGHRLLQQFPWTTDGRNRSERALLQARAEGAKTHAGAFVAAQRQEERRFLGDAIAFDYLNRLDHPTEPDDRRLGGARVADWRYDPASRTVV